MQRNELRNAMMFVAMALTLSASKCLSHSTHSTASPNTRTLASELRGRVFSNLAALEYNKSKPLQNAGAAKGMRVGLNE